MAPNGTQMHPKLHFGTLRNLENRALVNIKNRFSLFVPTRKMSPKPPFQTSLLDTFGLQNPKLSGFWPQKEFQSRLLGGGMGVLLSDEAVRLSDEAR